MEKAPYSKEGYDNLVEKQEKERKDMVNQAHGEALVIENEKSLRSIELADLEGKRLREVAEYLETTYGDSAHTRIPRDIANLQEEFKDGKKNAFFKDGISVDFISWSEEQQKLLQWEVSFSSADFCNFKWDSSYRVVLKKA